MRFLLVFASVLLAPIVSLVGAQQPTASGPDIFIAALDTRDGRLTIGRPLNITARPGYDNQPSFTPDGAGVLFTSTREDAQADTYRYDIATRAITRLTRTSESEYSPTVIPGGSRFSVVRVEADSTQRLWHFALNGSDPQVVLERVKPVGYHAWGDDSTLVLFVLGTPPRLMRADTRTGDATVLVENPGRSLQRVAGQRAISFVRKGADGDNWIVRYDLATGAFTPLVRALEGSEDHAWTPGGTILMARANRVFAWEPGRVGDWTEIAVFTARALQRVTRLAVSPLGDRIALVAEPTP